MKDNASLISLVIIIFTLFYVLTNSFAEWSS